ncbi:hypothetical protein ALC62_13303 [Cyphomyrmex costatus]|uniref:SRCR domain-containing protein n=1 Tax=Cyphomyrmex costatus TaxID=456900 RepID=A0A151IA55_9HYME|nr:hypothetical protein ALC62_13303 [Cyphomyrmex costatus]
MENSTWIPLAASTTSRSNLSPTFKPTWKPFTFSSPLWIPIWTTLRPFYDRSEHHVIYHDYDHTYRGSRYQDYEPQWKRSEWKPSNNNLKQSSDSNYVFQDHLDRQWMENHRIDQEQKPIYYDRPKGSWSYEHRNQNHHYDHRYYPPSFHYHHHHHYHNYRSTSNPPVNPSWNSDNPATLIGNRKYDQGFQGYTASTGDWHFDPHNSDHYDKHAALSETDQRQYQPYFPSRGYNQNNNQFYNIHNETKFSSVPYLLANQRTNHDLPPIKQDYNRTTPGLHHSSFNHTFSFAGNLLLNNSNNSNKIIKNLNQNKLRQNSLLPSWVGQENMTWNQSNRSFTFHPSMWHDQQNVQEEIQTHSSDQDLPFPIYYVQPVHPLIHSKKSIRPTPISGQVIRLRDGFGPSNGYVEVQGVLPGWGILCDSRNSWTLREAHILCRQLGYSRSSSV